MKYPALAYIIIYGFSLLAFVLAPTPITLVFVVPAILICEKILLPAMYENEARHRAN